METLKKQLAEQYVDESVPIPTITPYSMNMQFTEPVHMRLYKLAFVPSIPPTNTPSPDTTDKRNEGNRSGFSINFKSYSCSE
jgi:hypothetical protein